MNECIFCRIVKDHSLAQVVDEDEHTLTFLDKRPLFHGHCLLIPKIHYQTLPQLPENLVEPLFQKGRFLATVVQRAMGAQGTFVALNNIVSQSIPHLHLHIVPRKKGDGLRGFFWPRHTYANNIEMGLVGDRIRKVIELTD